MKIEFGDLTKSPEATRRREIYAIRKALDQMVYEPRKPRSPGLMTSLERALHNLEKQS